MTKVTTFLTGRQEALMGIMQAKRADWRAESYAEDCFAWGMPYIWIPAEDFALLTHAAATPYGSGPLFINARQRLDFLTLEGDAVQTEEVELPIARKHMEDGIRAADITGLDLYWLFNIALRYGQVAHGCGVLKLKRMTKRYGKLEKMSKMLNDGRTYAGQAHFPMLQGALGRRCAECSHFDPKANLRGDATQGRCGKWAELMGVPLKKAPLFPVSAQPCKYFEEKANAKAS